MAFEQGAGMLSLVDCRREPTQHPDIAGQRPKNDHRFSLLVFQVCRIRMVRSTDPLRQASTNVYTLKRAWSAFVCLMIREVMVVSG